MTAKATARVVRPPVRVELALRREHELVAEEARRHVVRRVAVAEQRAHVREPRAAYRAGAVAHGGGGGVVRGLCRVDTPVDQSNNLIFELADFPRRCSLKG